MTSIEPKFNKLTPHTCCIKLRSLEKCTVSYFESKMQNVVYVANFLKTFFFTNISRWWAEYQSKYMIFKKYNQNWEKYPNIV